MKTTLLIRLTTASETATYEGCALALTLASFGQTVQLMLDSSVFGMLIQPNTRIHGMLKSLELYDIPPAWIADDPFSHWMTTAIPPELASQLKIISHKVDFTQFAQIFTF